MTTTDSIFQRALSNMLTEIFDGPPARRGGAYCSTKVIPGCFASSTRSKRAQRRSGYAGKTTIAAHVDHVQFGLSIMNRWAAGEANPWAGATERLWQRTTVTAISANYTRRVCATKPKNGEMSSLPARIGTTWELPPLLHGRSHGVSLRGNQANPRGAE